MSETVDLVYVLVVVLWIHALPFRQLSKFFCSTEKGMNGQEKKIKKKIKKKVKNPKSMEKRVQM